MQQYFGDNFDINEDPIRQTYKNQTNDTNLNNNPLLPQPQENPLLPNNDNLNNTVNNVFLTEITKPSNELSVIPRMKQTDDINTYNNEMNRFNNLSQEILEKEKELMNSKGQIITLKNDIGGLQEEIKKITLLEYENSELNKKVNSLLKEQQIIMDARETNNKLLIELEKYKSEIDKLRTILSKNSIDIYDESDDSDGENIIPIKKPKTKPKPKQKPKGKKKRVNNIQNNNIQKNRKSSPIDKLKQSLLSHYPHYSEIKLNKMFEDLDLDDNINITRDLLIAITDYMKIE
tara:strand:+ start:63 stop:932 length:870 start_codon:yes stop_codon:yes gene_type:complete